MIKYIYSNIQFKLYNNAKIFCSPSEKSVLNLYYFGIEVALKGEKPFEITIKIDNANAKMAHKTRKSTRKLPFLTLFYRERRTPKRNAVGSTPITDAKKDRKFAVFSVCYGIFTLSDTMPPRIMREKSKTL